MTKAQRVRYNNRRDEVLVAIDKAVDSIRSMKKILKASLEVAADGSDEFNEDADRLMYTHATLGGLRGCALLMIQTIVEPTVDLTQIRDPKPGKDLPS